jgi:hypothetical protein
MVRAILSAMAGSGPAATPAIVASADARQPTPQKGEEPGGEGRVPLAGNRHGGPGLRRGGDQVGALDQGLVGDDLRRVTSGHPSQRPPAVTTVEDDHLPLGTSPGELFP